MKILPLSSSSQKSWESSFTPFFFPNLTPNPSANSRISTVKIYLVSNPQLSGTTNLIQTFAISCLDHCHSSAKGLPWLPIISMASRVLTTGLLLSLLLHYLTVLSPPFLTQPYWPHWCSSTSGTLHLLFFPPK